jgi:hypothetical protein
MALQATVQVYGGLTATDAYIRCRPLHWKKDESGDWYTVIDIEVWNLDPEVEGAVQLTAPDLDRKKVSGIDLTAISADPVSWAYAQVKPDIPGAVDV